MTSVPRVVLASGSPRRAELLTRLNIAHVVDPADVAEEVLADESPEGHVRRLARAKAVEVAGRHPDALVLAGDTVVVLDGTILGKPESEEGASEMLKSLSGRSHRVVGGLALASPGAGVVVRSDRTEVRLRDLDRATVDAYVATGEPMDKAGGYGIQGLGGALVRSIEGDYYTVVGLSLFGLTELLAEAGLRITFEGLARV